MGVRSNVTVVITGTDTGVGKTFVGCGVAEALVAQGQTVVAIKPVETGCADPPAPTEDGVLLAAATGQRSPAKALRRFRTAAAPTRAMELEGGAVELGELVGEIGHHGVDASVVMVEGAGGLLSPLSWDWNALHLARALGAPVLVVASDRLGCINHTLLTLDRLDAAGIPALGVALSASAAPDDSSGSNASAIARLAGCRVATVPRTHGVELARSFARIATWLTI